MTKQLVLNWKYHKNGIMIFAKSKDFERIFKTENKTHFSNNGKIIERYYTNYYNNDSIDLSLELNTNRLFTNRVNPNLCFLAFKGLEKGVYFVINGVFSEEEIMNYLRRVETIIPRIYRVCQGGLVQN